MAAAYSDWTGFKSVKVLRVFVRGIDDSLSHVRVPFGDIRANA